MVPAPMNTPMPDKYLGAEKRGRLYSVYLRPWVLDARWATPGVVPYITDLNVVPRTAVGAPAVKRRRLRGKRPPAAAAQGTRSFDLAWRWYIDGHIVSGDLLFARGMYLERGDLIAEIENTETLLTEILLPESSAEEVEIGAPVRLRVWSQPVDTVGGRVTHIAPAAEDSEYGHVIRVRAELHDTGGAVLPGMTGQAKIEGQRYPAIVVFTRALVRFVTVQVWSWLP